MENYRARAIMLLVIFIFPALVECKVVLTNTTKLCSTKSIVTINGKFPGPAIYAREGDNVNIKLTNHVQYNAWREAVAHGLGRRASIHHAVSNTAILMSEWWKADVEAVVNQATQTGLPPNISDAHIVNGQTGAVPGCPSPGFTLHVESGKTYLLRIINAALNDELFLKIAGHNITVVEVDAA
ncbi:hypothetical protein NC652_020646 [Populus alba x Populus x berolinensis]|nr:hypothetical protein NC652_020646 [Populus alba x Populus x berolinensis]